MARTRSRKAGSDRLEQIRQVVSRIRGWAPAAEVLTSVRAFPTIFPQLDVATRLGGWPTQRVALLHGPSNHGKTQLLHGLGASALEAGGFYALADAEYTTDVTWLRKLVGALAEHPGFQALRPVNYEGVTDAVRSLLEAVIEAKRAGDLAEETPVLIGVDSIVKLVPKDLLAKVQAKVQAEVKDEGKRSGVDGARGRGAMIQAAFNSAWMKELPPMLYEANAGFVTITRESENVDRAYANEPEFKLRGGKDLQFESSLTARVRRGSWVKRGDQVIGERHEIKITKTKVGGKDDRDIVCHYHSSNGVAAVEGFDRARDVADMALAHGVLEKDGKTAVLDPETGEHWKTFNDCVAGLGTGAALVEMEQRAREAATAAVQAGAQVTAAEGLA